VKHNVSKPQTEEEEDCGGRGGHVGGGDGGT
jgi:hypothetical protein